jgi:PAS domain S-box-containing protein
MLKKDIRQALLFGEQKYGRVMLTLFLLGGALLVDPSSLSADILQKANPSLLYRESWRTSTQGMVYVDDIDGDDRDEFLYWELGKESADSITYYDEKLSNIAARFSPFISDIYVYVTNWDNQGEKEIIVSQKIHNTAFLNLRSRRGDIIISSFPALDGLDRDNSGSWDGSVMPKAALDINGDGYTDIICAAVTFQDQEPRGIYAYDLKTNELIWKYSTQAIVENIILADLNLDEIPEILCITSPPSDDIENGRSLLVLSFTGQRLREFEPRDNLSGCLMAVQDIDLNGFPDVVLCTYSEQRLPGEGSLEKTYHIKTYNNQGVPQDSHEVQGTVSALQVHDILGDERLEIIVGTEDGCIRIFDCHLDSIQGDKALSDIDYTVIEDINGDGRPEIIISSHDPDRTVPFSQEFQTVVLNTDLERIAQYTHGGQPFVLRGSPNRLLLLSASELSILALGHRPYALTPRNLLIASGLVAILLLVPLYVILRRRRDHPLLSHLRQEIVDDLHFGLILLDAKGHIVTLNESVNTMIGLDKASCLGHRYDTVLKSETTGDINDVIDESFNASTDKGRQKELNLNVDGQEKVIAAEIVPLVDTKNKDLGRLIILQDVTELYNLKNVAMWLSMARDLAHKIKNPLTPMKLALQRMQTVAHQNLGQEATVFDRYIDANLNEINRLLKITDGFMKIIDVKPPQYQSVDINTLITSVLKEYEHSFSERIKLHVDLGEDVPPIRADQNQIEDILRNLLTNAMAAIETQGSINISTSYEQTFREEPSAPGMDESVWIEISDTGCGIPTDEIDKVFEPSYSRFEGGTGLGLATVRKSVENHRGTIHVESREGVGTKFALSFPVK